MVVSSSSREWDEGGKHLLGEFLLDGRELGEFPMVGGTVDVEVGKVDVPVEGEGECRVLVVVAAMVSASDWR